MASWRALTPSRILQRRISLRLKRERDTDDVGSKIYSASELL
jgi:hypothetical protein